MAMFDHVHLIYKCCLVNKLVIGDQVLLISPARHTNVPQVIHVCLVFKTLCRYYLLYLTRLNIIDSTQYS